MVAAIDYVHHAIPPGALILVDHETRETLEYYLGRDDKNLDASAKRSDELYLGGYRVVMPREYEWAFQVDKLPARIAELEQELRPVQGPLWIVSASWFQEPLASRLPKQLFAAREFGRISVVTPRH
jgi:hypothetical protein